MNILAIDPGNEQSAWLVFDTELGKPTIFGITPNESLVSKICKPGVDEAVIEMVASYGMAVGKEVFETVFWIGRFYEILVRADCETRRMYRMEVKQNLCHDSRAKDSNIRQALIDRYGGQDLAIGKKKTPGPLYGISKDIWSALAIAVTRWDQNRIAVDA